MNLMMMRARINVLDSNIIKEIQSWSFVTRTNWPWWSRGKTCERISRIQSSWCSESHWKFPTRRLQSCPLQTVSLNGSAMLSFVSMLLFVCHWAVHEWNITGTSLTMSGLDACLARASVNHEVHVFTHEGFGCAPCVHGPPYPSHCTFMGKLWFVFSFFPCALMWDALIPVAASSPIFPPCYQCPFFFVFGYRGPYYFSSRLMSINHAKKEPYKSLYPGTCFICKMSKYLCSCTIFLRAIFFGSPRKKFPHGKGAWW